MLDINNTMLQLIETLTEAKPKCHCSDEGIRKIIKSVGGNVAEMQETQAQFVVTVELSKNNFEKLEKAINDKFPDHLRTITKCGPAHASVAIWKKD